MSSMAGIEKAVEPPGFLGPAAPWPLRQYHQMIWQLIFLAGGWHLSFQVHATGFDAANKAL